MAAQANNNYTHTEYNKLTNKTPDFYHFSQRKQFSTVRKLKGLTDLIWFLTYIGMLVGLGRIMCRVGLVSSKAQI